MAVSDGRPLKDMLHDRDSGNNSDNDGGSRSSSDDDPYTVSEDELAAIFAKLPSHYKPGRSAQQSRRHEQPSFSKRPHLSDDDVGSHSRDGSDSDSATLSERNVSPQSSSSSPSPVPPRRQRQPAPAARDSGRAPSKQPPPTTTKSKQKTSARRDKSEDSNHFDRSNDPPIATQQQHRSGSGGGGQKAGGSNLFGLPPIGSERLEGLLNNSDDDYLASSRASAGGMDASEGEKPKTRRRHKSHSARLDASLSPSESTTSTTGQLSNSRTHSSTRASGTRVSSLPPHKQYKWYQKCCACCYSGGKWSACHWAGAIFGLLLLVCALALIVWLFYILAISVGSAISSFGGGGGSSGDGIGVINSESGGSIFATPATAPKGFNARAFQYLPHLAAASQRKSYHDTIVGIVSSQLVLRRLSASVANQACFKMLKPPEEDFDADGAVRYSRQRENAFAYYVCSFSNFDEFQDLVAEAILPYDEKMAVDLIKQIHQIVNRPSPLPATNGAAPTSTAESLVLTPQPPAIVTNQTP